jgi:excisionase family DNA binding protein
MEKLLTIGQVAKQLNVTLKTLRIWDEIGELKAIRTPGRHRMYRQSDIDNFLGIQKSESEQITLPVAAYNRVSSHEQKQKGDLERQQGRVLYYCADKGYKVEYVYAEVGSGMSDSRPKLLQVMKLARDKKISRVICEHKDRLTRFNFNLVKLYFESYGVEVEVMQETLPKTYEAELIEDMLSLIASFSSRISGKRSAERRKK